MWVNAGAGHLQHLRCSSCTSEGMWPKDEATPEKVPLRVSLAVTSEIMLEHFKARGHG